MIDPIFALGRQARPPPNVGDALRRRLRREQVAAPALAPAPWWVGLQNAGAARALADQPPLRADLMPGRA